MRPAALLLCAAATTCACASPLPDAVVSQGELACAERLLEPALPPHFPRPPSAGEHVSASELALGRRLFYESRLSGNGQQSCASCHRQALAFSDGRARARGSTGELHPRSSMSLVNVAYARTLTWANPVLRSLEQQALVPMFGDRPVELGTPGSGEALLAALEADADYRALFETAFADAAQPITLHNLVAALASFERALISATSAYDHHLAGDARALSDAAKRGLGLFASPRLGCAGCHGGFNLDGSDSEDSELFHNTALYNEAGDGSYPDSRGLVEFTGRPEDRGRFKVPTLRNIALTAPYMHDGSIASLDAVLGHYAAGGRSADNPYKSPRLRSFSLDARERADVLAFLRSLTDEQLVQDPCLGPPARGLFR